MVEMVDAHETGLMRLEKAKGSRAMAL